VRGACFARLGGVSVRTLRHYDEIGLPRPAAVDPDTGYRGYSAAQLGQINRIMALNGVTLDGLCGMLLVRRAQLGHELDQHKNQSAARNWRRRSGRVG